MPSVAYRRGGEVVDQAAGNHPLRGRILLDYRLIEDYLERYYDQAFNLWYAHHYEFKRMVTLPLDGGCNWGKNPRRRCKHCSIQGLTPKTAVIDDVIPALERAVGELGANVYAAGDSTFGFSRAQWGGTSGYLDVEAFNPTLLKGNSKGINSGAEAIHASFELARTLGYKLYVSGILGLAGTTLRTLREEVESWLSLAETYQDCMTALAVSLPGVIPGSRMYWELYQSCPEVRGWHGEIVPCRRLTETFIARNTEVRLVDVEAAVQDVARGVLGLAASGRNPLKFGGYMLGGKDETEAAERALLDDRISRLT